MAKRNRIDDSDSEAEPVVAQPAKRPRSGTATPDGNSSEEESLLSGTVLQYSASSSIPPGEMPQIRRAPANSKPVINTTEDDGSDFKQLPSAKKPPSRRGSALSSPKRVKPEAQSDEDFKDEPQKASSKKTASKPPSRRGSSASSSTKTTSAKRQAVDSGDDDEDAPIVPKKPPPKKRAVESAVKKEPLSNNATPEKPKSKRGKKAATAVAPSSSQANRSESGSPSKKKSDDEDDDTHKWWLQENPLGDGTNKWTYLEHNGVYFPPPYNPHGVKMLYDGKPVTLGSEAEEVATFFAGVVGTDHAENPIFVKNFFNDFMGVIKKHEKNCPIKVFDKCDFTPLVDMLAAEKERKKAMTKAEKDALKAEKTKIDELYGWATIDGRKEKVGNFRVEPPGLFRGRGAHPKAGKLKLRLRPEDITLNLAESAPVPPLPPGQKWKDIVHDNTVTWLATWTENVNGQPKYVFLSANSSWKGMSDFKKFEKARELKKHVHRIRADYTVMLKDREMRKRQLATALYLIDRFALRAGNEKGEDEADTVGCCSLRYEHVTLQENNVVVFDFLGKDSIRYYNSVTVDPQVHKNLRLFKKDHKEGDDLFDRIDTSSLNKHLTSLMPGLTAKVFRTYNASHTFQQELEQTPADGTVAEKVLAYNRANRQVAVLCNHQRSVPKAFETQMGKMRDKIRGLKYQRRELKRKLLELDPKLKKTRPELVGEESDLDDEWVEQYLASEAEKEKEKDAKKLAKVNEERAAKGEPPLKLDDIKKPKAASMREPTVESLEKKCNQLTHRIQAMRTQMIDRDENKTTALGTSKINYIDPRITAAWCHKHDVPIEKMFPKTLRDKFKWAMEADADWEF